MFIGLHNPVYYEHCRQRLQEMYPNGLPPYMELRGATTMQTECRERGHQQLVDCSEAGPDSGNMDHQCLHCGEYFHVQLY